MLGEGGYESAGALAGEIMDALPRASRDQRARAVPLLTRVWIALGELDRADSLWEKFGEDLSCEHPARLALAVARHDAPASLRRALQRRFDPYVADYCIQHGALSLEELARLLLMRPRTMLRNKELELLLHNAWLRSGALDFACLNRHLDIYDLPSCRYVGAAPCVFAGLVFDGRGQGRHQGPLVSVLVAARNAEFTVRQAVDSLLRQDYASLEILVCDDASQDGTLSVLKQHYADNTRVRLFTSLAQQGAYNVRNALIERARGELIAFHDADDLALPNRISMQVASLTRLGGAGASVANWLRLRPDGSVAFFADGKAERLAIVTLMFKRDVLASLGRYPPARFGADLDFYRRVMRQTGRDGIVRVMRPLVLGLWSGGSITRSPGAEALETGYRSPARRRYSELLLRRDHMDVDISTDVLRAMGNYMEPSGIRELG